MQSDRINFRCCFLIAGELNAYCDSRVICCTFKECADDFTATTGFLSLILRSFELRNIIIDHPVLNLKPRVARFANSMFLLFCLNNYFLISDE